MKYRKLRIAFSVACGIACVLLIMLWVRSYWWQDEIWRISPSSEVIGGASATGMLYLKRIPFDPGQSAAGWYHETGEVGLEYGGFEWDASKGELVIPIWFICTIFAALAAAPWLGRRFSLRTLLIVTTLIAAVLGFAVWACRK